ncbi:cobalamin-binding protein [Colwellia sp. E2M01]|uniref:cobalamin-binding protein n=1 Tax=Colwellia sp. E2M01 TaxID=2841561 RepID=UPI001C09D7BB|nr:cobalamin-binding protein [Colwellia sp. E2M01]MBU2869324.1 cobalamin-binding protein [Colwellia sp. E2M01]
MKSLLFIISVITSQFAYSQTSAEIKKPTIIALSPHIVEMLYDIGAGEQIIGTTSFANHPEEAKKIPVIGNYVRLQLERVIELQPDLIIAWKSGNPSDDLARLKQLGFTVVYSQPNTFKDIADETRLFGKLTGNSEKSQQVAKEFEKELKAITQTYNNKTEITGFYELWSRPLTTVAQHSWPQQFLNICGVNNPFEKALTPYPQISIEQVLPASVQVIIQPNSKSQKERESFNWQNWPMIPAVKNNNIIKPDTDAIHRMTLRSLNALDSLCFAVDNIRKKLFSTSTVTTQKLTLGAAK